MLLGGRVVMRLVAVRSLGGGTNRLRWLLANTRWLLRSTIPVGICVMPGGHLDWLTTQEITTEMGAERLKHHNFA
jgi:hypothetical protein